MRAYSASYEAHLDSLIVAAVEDELSNGPDARSEIVCPACNGGADGMVSWERVLDWRCYGTYTVRMVCDGCGFDRELTLR